MVSRSRELGVIMGRSLKMHRWTIFVKTKVFIMNRVLRIPHNRTVSQNAKNMTLIETARTMLADSNLPVMFWNEAIYEACYTLNRVLMVKKFGKTSYELLNRRKPNLGFFVGYATPLKQVFNKRTRQVEEWASVEVQRYTQNVQGSGPDWMFDYKDFFESFNLDSLVEEAVLRPYYECENAVTSWYAGKILFVLCLRLYSYAILWFWTH